VTPVVTSSRHAVVKHHVLRPAAAKSSTRAAILVQNRSADFSAACSRVITVAVTLDAANQLADAKLLANRLAAAKLLANPLADAKHLVLRPAAAKWLILAAASARAAPESRVCSLGCSRSTTADVTAAASPLAVAKLLANPLAVAKLLAANRPAVASPAAAAACNPLGYTARLANARRSLVTIGRWQSHTEPWRTS